MIDSVPEIKISRQFLLTSHILKWRIMEPWGWEGPQEIILSHIPASEGDYTKYTPEK